MTVWHRLAQALLALFCLLVALWVGFGLAYAATQDYRPIEGLYWGMQTLTTTGYGDRPPVNDTGLVLSMLLQPAAVLVTLLVGANFVKRAIPEVHVFTEAEQAEVLTYVREQRAKASER